MSPRTNLRGILAMLLAAALFGLMEPGLKLLSPHYPALQGRPCARSPRCRWLIAYVAWRGAFGSLLRVRWRLHCCAVRSHRLLTAFAFALRHLPLAGYAIFFVAPLMIHLLSGHCSARRWARALDRDRRGPGGRDVVLRPTGTACSPGPARGAVRAACYSVSAVTVRIVGRTDSTRAKCLADGDDRRRATMLALPDWTPVRWPMAGAAGIAVSGFSASWRSPKLSPRRASAIAPFEYSALAWGLAIDWLVWHTLPDRWMLVGAAIHLASVCIPWCGTNRGTPNPTSLNEGRRSTAAAAARLACTPQADTHGECMNKSITLVLLRDGLVSPPRWPRPAMTPGRIGCEQAPRHAEAAFAGPTATTTAS